jgi:glycerol-3-phosphate dehydrogenase
MRIAVIGGGINGLCSAWCLAESGHQVTVFERGRLMGATSSASSKLLHGGLRYLETGQFLLVREALRERDAWIKRAPLLARPLPILLPIYHDSRRPRWMLGLGMKLYDMLAGRSALPKSEALSKAEVSALMPTVNTDGLVGGFRYYDGQMDDRGLGCWVAEQCRQAGVIINEDSPVVAVSPEGSLKLAERQPMTFDRVLNIAGPWAEKLLVDSGIKARYGVDVVRGSHLIVDRVCPHALLLEVPGAKRIFFVLPWEERSLIGTTEVRQTLDAPIVCSDQETDYLINAYNHFHSRPITPADIVETFAGVRPLVKSASDPSKARRDYAFQRDGRLLTVFGGKWTTSMALAEKLKRKVH